MHVLIWPATNLTHEFVQVAAMQPFFVQAANAPWSNQVSAEEDTPTERGHKKKCIAQNRQNCLRATRVTWREWILSLITRNWWRGASWENWGKGCSKHVRNKEGRKHWVLFLPSFAACATSLRATPYFSQMYQEDSRVQTDCNSRHSSEPPGGKSSWRTL